MFNHANDDTYSNNRKAYVSERIAVTKTDTCMHLRITKDSWQQSVWQCLRHIVGTVYTLQALHRFGRVTFFKDCATLKMLLLISMLTILSWIPGHQGIDFNDIANRIAKVTAHDIYTARLSAPVSVSYNDVVKLLQDIAAKSWHTKWNQDATGFYTRHLIPEVGTKVTFPEKLDVGMLYCRLLLHDTLLRNDAHRTGISDTPVCECGVERFADHFLLCCNRHQDAGIKLKNVVQNIMDLSACQSRIHLSESLLLAPRCNDVIAKELEN